ncbi:MAG: MerR family transcriptional regulator [Bacteroidetes bacterium]|nr:MerR family transcriptional regulator [Bacteroidota bacterium]MBS1939509.1 MerR family transcriptional regulator [Bacteroidota bacterium]
MPLKEKTIERMYWSIGEVADELGVNTSLLRYWEKEFGTLRPKRTNKGERLYTKDDIEQLRRIQHLVKDKGFTLQGAKGQLRGAEPVEVPEAPPPVSFPVEEVRSRLQRIRTRLVELREVGG